MPVLTVEGLPVTPNSVEVWITKEGERIALNKMEDKHLDNALKMLKLTLAAQKTKIALLEGEKKRRADEETMREAEAAEKRKLLMMAPTTSSRHFRDE